MRLVVEDSERESNGFLREDDLMCVREAANSCALQ